MALEIERKYLVRGGGYREEARSQDTITQGFLNDDPDRVVRVRISGEKATLTIKSPLEGAVRREYEYSIPVEDARVLIDEVCLPSILSKTRYIVEHEGLTWEVDEFHGDNDGLIIAEVELPNAGMEPSLPSWVGSEVTGDTRYYNANLVSHPYKSWKKDDP